MAWPVEGGSAWSQRKQHSSAHRGHADCSLQQRASQPRIDRNTCLPNRIYRELAISGVHLVKIRPGGLWVLKSLRASLGPFNHSLCVYILFSENQGRVLLFDINSKVQVFFPEVFSKCEPAIVIIYLARPSIASWSNIPFISALQASAFNFSWDYTPYLMGLLDGKLFTTNVFFALKTQRALL